MIIRTTAPSRDEFIDLHLTPGEPLVVRGGLSSWPSRPPWTFEDLVDRVGAHRVPLYGTLFDLVGVSTFRDYYDRFLASADPGRQPPYLRWFARQSDQRLPWADDAFAALEGAWHAAAWLPESGYVFPATSNSADVTREPFPAKGIFICGRGGMTAWHVDPWHSDAYLCQAIGDKRVVILKPGTPAPDDGEGLATVIDHPTALPTGWPTDPVVDVVLSPGDCVYIPQDHPHAALALSPSLSLTWNFVHESHDQGYQALVASGCVDDPAFRHFSTPAGVPPVAEPGTSSSPPSPSAGCLSTRLNDRLPRVGLARNAH